MEDIKVLKKLPLFNGLESMELVEVAKYVHSRKIPAGETIIRQGDNDGAFYIIKSGSAVVYLQAEREKKMLGRFQPGDSFGEVSLIDHLSRSATVEAESDMDLLWIKRGDFTSITHRGDHLSVKLLNNLLHDLCDKLRRTNQYLLLSE